MICIVFCADVFGFELCALVLGRGKITLGGGGIFCFSMVACYTFIDGTSLNFWVDAYAHNYTCRVVWV